MGAFHRHQRGILPITLQGALPQRASGNWLSSARCSSMLTIIRYSLSCKHSNLPNSKEQAIAWRCAGKIRHTVNSPTDSSGRNAPVPGAKRCAPKKIRCTSCLRTIFMTIYALSTFSGWDTTPCDSSGTMGIAQASIPFSFCENSPTHPNLKARRRDSNSAFFAWHRVPHSGLDTAANSARN